MVVQRDRMVEPFGRDLHPVQLEHVLLHCLDQLAEEGAADVLGEVLRIVEVAGELPLLRQLEHAGEVADAIADRGEEEAVEAFEVAVERHLDDPSRQVADVRLVVGIALDDPLAVARAHDAHRQRVGRVQHLARYVDRQVAHEQAVRRCGPPLLGTGEFQIESDLFAFRQDRVQACGFRQLLGHRQ
ncbi:MAG: hypothetical protein IPI81_03155 [Flavobacteriales bacterium]|nr:hypothetical protein [Flavobacteriales bacterium]